MAGNISAISWLSIHMSVTTTALRSVPGSANRSRASARRRSDGPPPRGGCRSRPRGAPCCGRRSIGTSANQARELPEVVGIGLPQQLEQDGLGGGDDRSELTQLIHGEAPVRLGPRG